LNYNGFKIALMLLISITSADAGYINGTITGSNGEYLNNSYILTNQSNSTYSNSTGFYSLSLPDGIYNITISNNPRFYQNQTDNIQVSGTIIHDVNLTIKPTGTITGCVYVAGGINPCTILHQAVDYSKRVRWFF